MIPVMNTIAWSQTAPWAETRQLEQDLIISRAIVELFSDPVLGNQLRFAVARHSTKSISQPAAVFRGHRSCSRRSWP
jgi:hypothetical protein